MRILTAIKSFYRIPNPSAEKVEEAKQEKLFKAFGFQTFLAGTIGYSLYYVCRTSLNVVKRLIDGNSTMIEKLDEATGQMVLATQYDFTSVALFWVIASAISFLLPVLNWKYRK